MKQSELEIIVEWFTNGKRMIKIEYDTKGYKAMFYYCTYKPEWRIEPNMSRHAYLNTL